MERTLLTLATGALVACALTGCVNLKRADDPAHFYRLSARQATTTPVATATHDLTVGLGVVEIPSYLLDRRIAICRGACQLHYLEYDRWAERLDKGIQRAVAANLASFLDSDQVLLSAWSRNEVAAEIYVFIQRFECDENGQVFLEARWRITSPGRETTWRIGQSHLVKQGPAFRDDPAGAVDTLSQALADLSQQIAVDLRGVSAGLAVAGPETRR